MRPPGSTARAVGCADGVPVAVAGGRRDTDVIVASRPSPRRLAPLARHPFRPGVRSLARRAHDPEPMSAPLFQRPMSLPMRWLCPLLIAPAIAFGQGAVVKTDEVRAELVAHAPEGVSAGKPLSLGLLIRHAPHWHTYWKNPGDSGLPTTLEWTLPAGVQAGPIE